jgi:hypothetical protein
VLVITVQISTAAFGTVVVEVPLVLRSTGTRPGFIQITVTVLLVLALLLQIVLPVLLVLLQQWCCGPC